MSPDTFTLYDQGACNAGISLEDPDADRIVFWDESAGAYAWLTVGSGLTVTDTTITVSDVGLTDVKVAIDSGATAGYLGAAYNDGVFRTDTTLDYADGGDYITIGIDATLKSNYDAGYAHVSADGSDHSFIDQSVISGATPTFTGTNFTGIDISTATNLAVTAPIVLTDDTLSHSGADGYVHTPSSGASAQLLQYSSAGTSKWITASGDLTIADGGALSIGTDKVNDTHIDWGTGANQVDASDIPLAEIGTATYDDIYDWANNTQSAGIISGFAVSDSGSGEIDIAAGTGILKTSDSDIGANVFFDYAGTTNVALTDNSTNWVYIDYNSGTPTAGVTTDWTGLDLHTQIIIGKVYRAGTAVHFNDTKQALYDLARVIMQRQFEVDGAVRASGMVLTTTNQYVELTAGAYYEALSRNSITSKDTDPGGDGDSFSYWHQNGGTWTEVTTQTQIDNTQYNDTTSGLATLTNNRYGVHWVFVDHDDHLNIVYGIGDYLLAAADAAQLPTIPTILSDFGILIGKIVIKKSDTATTSTESAFTEQFVGVAASDHGALGGLADDDHTQYVLANATRALSDNWDIGNYTLTANGLTIDGTFTDGTLSIVGGDISSGGTFTATSLVGALTGNASTATALETTRAIGGVNFDGTAAITPTTIVVADTTDTTCYIGLWESATGSLLPKTDAGATYNAGTGILTATGFSGPITGAVTGNADTATALATARDIGGTSFDGTGNIDIANVIVADTTDTTCWVGLFESATGTSLAPKTDGGLTYNAGTANLATTTFTGALTGNASGSSGSCTGNAATATALATTRAIGGVNFDGTAAITPTTIVVADTTDTTCYVGLWESATGSLLPKTDAGITYNAGTGMLTATGLTGPLTGNADTSTTAGNLSGTPDLPDGTTATTQGAADNSTKLATTAYADAAAAGGGATVALDNLAGVAINTDLISDAADTDSLGSTTKEWLNLYIGDAGKIYLGLGQDCSINRSAANEMLLTATSGVTVEGVKIDGGVVTGASSLTSTSLVGALTGNADTATALETTRAIGGVNFDGTAAITPTTIVVADTTDTTCYVGLWESATGSLLPKTDAGITYNAGTAALTATTFVGALTGQADTVATITGLAPDTATTQAAQANITSLGTLTALTVDNVAINTGTVTFSGATGVNLIKMPDNLAEALVIEEATTNYMTFVTTDNSEEVQLNKETQFDLSAYFDAVQTATGDGTTTIDWGLGNKFVFTFGAANETFTFTAPNGPCNLMLVLIQDGTGSRTATWPASVKWPTNGTAPTLSADPADVDVVSFFWDGSAVYYGQSALDFD